MRKVNEVRPTVIVPVEAIEQIRKTDSRYQLIDRLYQVGYKRLIFSKMGIPVKKQDKSVC